MNKYFLVFNLFLFSLLGTSQVKPHKNVLHKGRIEACGKNIVELVVMQDSGYCKIYVLNAKYKAIDTKHYTVKIMLYFGTDSKKPVVPANNYSYFIFPIEKWDVNFNKCEIELTDKIGTCKVEFKPIKNVEQPIRGRK